MKSLIVKILLLVTFSAGANVNAQQVSLAPIRVGTSSLVEEIKAFKSSNPNIKPADLAARANQALEKSGLNFELHFDAGTCVKVTAAKARAKDPNSPILLNGTLKSVDGEAASLALPEARFTDCGGCYMLMPLLQITTSDFVTVIRGQNIRFHLPSNFASNEIVLVDPKDKTAVRRKWRVPAKMEPIGVSYDENVLYLAFNEPELTDLSLEVFGEGTFAIGTRAEAEEGGKGVRGSGESLSSGLDYTKFDRWGKTYLVRFERSCKP